MPTTPKDADTLISEIIPSSEVEKLEYGRTEEILQPLMDLGYLKNADPALIAQGIRLFRKDYISINLIPDFAPNFLFLPESELESEELNLLHTLTALDGDFTIELLPDIGQVNLISRIIHYRLSIHHLFALPVDHPFLQDSLDAIKRLYIWIKNLPQDHIKLFNLLGNVPALIQHIAINKNGGLNEKIVAFKYHKASSASEFQVAVETDLLEEVTEDEQESDTDNEASMLKLETTIDDTFDELKQEPVFDEEEQDALKDSRKNRRKRSRMMRIQAMLEKLSAEQQKANLEINKKRNAIKAVMTPLATLQTQLNDQQKVIAESMAQKKKILDQLKDDRKNLKKKKRQLKRKIRKGKPQQEIDALRQKIKNIENSGGKIDTLEIELSTLSRKLFPIDEQLSRINKNLASFNKKLLALDEERKQLNSEKQKELKPLFDRVKELEQKVNKLKFSFRGKLKKALTKTYYENVIKKEIFEKRSRQKLEDFSEDHYNNYLIRLIQVFQWTNGFYYGKLDNEVGDRTFSALDDMVTYSKGLRLKFILSRLSENHSGTKGYWILNIKYLFAKLSNVIKDQDPDITTQDLIESYGEIFNEDDPNAAKIGNAVTDKGYDDIVTENKQDIKKGGVMRRIYYGIKGIASTLFKALKSIINIIKKGVKALIYLVKNLVKIIYKEIREGVRKFRDGMKFLFGKRQFATPTSKGSAIMTKFDFDFDTVTFTPPDVNNLELKQHADGLHRYSNNLEFTLVLTAKVLKWTFKFINASTPLGWGRLAIRIALEYKRLMIKWLVSIGRKLRKRIISIKYKLSKETAHNPA